MAEWTIESKKTYADPFNDVDLDVIFERSGQSWRVPAFWRGDSRWTVRFAPPEPGEYTYRLESTDRSNPDLNGRAGKVTITPYQGTNPLLLHGMLRISPNKRYFEHADGTPFYWLGDTWWTGLSDRLSWDGFQKLTADRKAKGFTVVQIVAGLVPIEEQAPSDPGYHNEGGYVWDQGFHRINPRYFDMADRRIEHLIGAGIAPAIVGAWSEKLGEMGKSKLEKHWRYVIARYGCDPVFWILGGEVFDPTPELASKAGLTADMLKELGGWTEIARYIRDTDPMHHPLTVHEDVDVASIDNLPLQDESVTDFQLFQPSHFSSSSLALEISQLNTHYARTAVTKPLVVGEIGYERLGETHLEDFQRMAFWLGMLNGAAGHTYGANGTWESYTSDKPFQRLKWSLLTWEEGMNLPGSYQVGLGAKLLQQYPWWLFAPHPEWVTPHGTTLLEARRDGVNHFHADLSGILHDAMASWTKWESTESEWSKAHGEFHLPYAAGIPGQVRFIYMPYFGLIPPPAPTILGLESDVKYHAYFWDPSLGVKFDLGQIERATQGEMIRSEKFDDGASSRWIDYGAKTAVENGKLLAKGATLTVFTEVSEANVRAAVEVKGDGNASLILRFHDPGNYLEAVYSVHEHAIYLLERKDGATGDPLGRVSIPDIPSGATLTAEAKGAWAVVSVAGSGRSYTSEIVHVNNTTAGSAGFRHTDDGTSQTFDHFELRRCPPPAIDENLDRHLYDARGIYRGLVSGGGLPWLDAAGISSWSDFGRERIVLLDAYRPDRLPYGRDWILVLEARPSH
jgi:hypothetical protein